MDILIAEDNEVSRKVLQLVLQKAGYSLKVANNGIRAWEELLKPGAPKIAILDWMMPEMDGIELCEKIRQNPATESTYIILLTSLNKKDQMLQGLAAGADDYVVKPFDKEELLARVRTGIRIRGLQEALNSRINELQAALDQIQTLEGIIPICMHCHKIRSDQEIWDRMEKYIEYHSKARFSHSICPECMDKHYPESQEEEEAGDGCHP